jgi:hypothetical protein
LAINTAAALSRVNAANRAMSGTFRRSGKLGAITANAGGKFRIAKIAEFSSCTGTIASRVMFGYSRADIGAAAARAIGVSIYRTGITAANSFAS